MPTLPLYFQVEQELGRPLEDELRRWREARLGAPAIARLLQQETGVDFHPQTVRRWLQELEIA